MSVGSVMAATTPIIPRVIKTSAKVNPSPEELKQFFPLSGKNPRAPPPPEIAVFSCILPPI